ncbi:hypothetical protein NBRC10512_005964 [Rhodotorula toruloides]
MLSTKTILTISALATAALAAPSVGIDDKGLGYGGYGNKGAVAYGGAAEKEQAADWANAEKQAEAANHAQAAHSGAEQVAAHNKEYNHANGAYDKAQGNAQEWNTAKKFGGNAGHGNAYNSGADVAEHEAQNNGHAAAYGSKLGGYGGYGGAKGKAVFLFDGIKKDIDNREFYYEEFCYKQFNIAEHNADVAKHNTAVVGGAAGLGGSYGGEGLKDKSGVHKRSVLGGGLDGGIFDKGAFLDGWGSIDAFDGGYGGKGLGLVGGAYGGKGFVGSGYGGAAKQGHANEWADADHYNNGANYAKANHAAVEQDFGHNKEYNHVDGAYDRAKGNAEEYNAAKAYGGKAGHANAETAGAEAAEHEAGNSGAFALPALSLLLSAEPPSSTLARLWLRLGLEARGGCGGGYESKGFPGLEICCRPQHRPSRLAGANVICTLGLAQSVASERGDEA